MTDTGKTGQGRVATRAIAAAAWSVALLALIWPLRLANLTVLNRSGVHVFGFWTYLNMLLALIPSLCLFGGSQVLVYFLPKCPEGSRRRFVVSFTVVAMSGALVGLGAIVLFPALHAYLGIEEHTRLVMLFLLVAVPVEVLNQVLRGVLQGSLRLADSEKALGIPQAIELVLLVIVFLIFPDFAVRHHVMLLMGAIVLRLLVTLGASAAMCVGTLRGDVDGTTPRPPRGVWRYAGYLHLNQIVDFVYRHADRWIVLYFFELEGLAAYAAARALAHLIGVIPMALRGIVFSTFCQLASPDEVDRRRRTFRLSVLVNSLPSFTVALGLVCFSGEIIGFLNRAYPAATARILLLLAAVASVTGLGGVNASYIMGRGGSRYTFFVAALGGAVQLGLTWLLLSRDGGAFDVALARSIAVVLMLVLTTWRVLRMLPGAIPAAYVVGAAVVTSTSALVAVTPLHAAWRAVIFVAGATLTVTTSLRQMDAPIRRLLLSPWRLVQLVLTEQRMTTEDNV